MRNLPTAIRTWDTSKGKNQGDIKWRLTRLGGASGERIYTSTGMDLEALKGPHHSGYHPTSDLHLVLSQYGHWAEGKRKGVGVPDWRSATNREKN